MPRYHFNVRNGPFGQDNEGTELPDTEAARVEGVRLLGEMLAQHAPQASPDQEWELDVTDSSGLLIYRLYFGVVTSPIIEQVHARTSKLLSQLP